MGDVRHVPGGLVLRVERPKGYDRGKLPREVGLDPKAEAILAAWLEVRGPEPGPIFTTSNGGRLQTSHVRRLMKTLAKRAGIDQRVHPHALRHTFACEVYREQPDRIVELMLALGHTKITTTQRYLQGIGANDVVAVTTRRVW
jgi:integrase